MFKPIIFVAQDVNSRFLENVQYNRNLQCIVYSFSNDVKTDDNSKDALNCFSTGNITSKTMWYVYVRSGCMQIHLFFTITKNRLKIKKLYPQGKKTRKLKPTFSLKYYKRNILTYTEI